MSFSTEFVSLSAQRVAIINRIYHIYVQCLQQLPTHHHAWAHCSVLFPALKGYKNYGYNVGKEVGFE